MSTCLQSLTQSVTKCELAAVLVWGSKSWKSLCPCAAVDAGFVSLAWAALILANSLHGAMSIRAIDRPLKI